MLGAASVSTSFLGGIALQDQRPTGWSWIAIGAFLAVAPPTAPTAAISFLRAAFEGPLPGAQDHLLVAVVILLWLLWLVLSRLMGN
jgi:hypothetical protein